MKAIVADLGNDDGRSFVPFGVNSLLSPPVPGQYVQSTPLPSGFSATFDPNWVAPQYVPSPLMSVAPAPVVQSAPVLTADEFRNRQRYAESAFNNSAVSGAGAKGAFQIMPSVLSDYIASGGKEGDLFDYEYNRGVRDWYVDWLLKRAAVNGNGNEQSDAVKWAKLAAAYNWGIGNLGKYLQQQKENGVDIYNSTDWVEGLNPETRDYVKFVALQQDTSKTRSNEAYKRALENAKVMAMGGTMKKLSSAYAGDAAKMLEVVRKFKRGGNVGKKSSDNYYGGEIEPAVLEASPQTARGRYRLAKKNYKQAKKDHVSFFKRLAEKAHRQDFISSEEEANSYIDKLSEMYDLTNARNEFKDAKDAYLSQWGGQNSIPAQLYRYYSRHFGHQSNRAEDDFKYGNGADIIDLGENVVRLTPDSKQSTALFNEFVENKLPSVRQASDYKNNPDLVIGDRFAFPASDVSIFGGIEDGKFRLDSLKNFNDNTTIIPARNIKSGMPLVSGIRITSSQDGEDYPSKRFLRAALEGATIESPDEALQLGRNRDEMMRSASIAADRMEAELDKLESQGRAMGSSYTSNHRQTVENLRKYAETGEYPSYAPDRKELARRLDQFGIPGALRYVPSLGPTYTNSKGEFSYSFVDPSGALHPVSDYNASILDGKTVLGNPSGGIFIGRMQNISVPQLNSLNEYLRENPSWIMRTDLGSFDQYRLDNPTLAGYLKQYFEHPKADDPNVYTVGTTAPNKLWDYASGGLLLKPYHKFEDGGQSPKSGVDIAGLVKRINETSNADFVRRLLDKRRKTLKNEDGTVSTHEMSYVTDGDNAIVFPNVQSVGRKLKRFSYPESLDRAIARGDTLHMSVPEAEAFTMRYKDFYPGFDRYGNGGIMLKPYNK